MYDAETQQRIFRYDVEMANFESATAIEFGRVVRASNGQWVFHVQPEPINGTFTEIKSSFFRNFITEGCRQVLDFRHAVFGLGWDVPKTHSGPPFDLDVLVLALGADNRLVSDGWFVYYNHLATGCRSIVHNGDARDGDSNKEDDETVTLNLWDMDERVKKVSFMINIYECQSHGHCFTQIPTLWVRVCNRDTNAELLRYDMDTEGFAGVPTIEVAQLVRLGDGRGWELTALGNTMQLDVDGLYQLYAPRRSWQGHIQTGH